MNSKDFESVGEKAYNENSEHNKFRFICHFSTSDAHWPFLKNKMALDTKQVLLAVGLAFFAGIAVYLMYRKVSFYISAANM